MSDDTAKTLTNVIKIDDARIQDHLGKIVRGTVDETLILTPKPTACAEQAAMSAVMSVVTREPGHMTASCTRRRARLI